MERRLGKRSEEEEEEEATFSFPNIAPYITRRTYEYYYTQRASSEKDREGSQWVLNKRDGFRGNLTKNVWHFNNCGLLRCVDKS